ncbi:hypothetical protein AAVH_41313, partial [Aphelenchoides avenae]
ESTTNASACKRLRLDVDSLERTLKVAEAARQRLAVEKDQLNMKLGQAERAFTKFSDRQQGLKESLEAEIRAQFSESKTMLDCLSKKHGELLETFNRQR